MEGPVKVLGEGDEVTQTRQVCSQHGLSAELKCQADTVTQLDWQTLREQSCDTLSQASCCGWQFCFIILMESSGLHAYTNPGKHSRPSKVHTTGGGNCALLCQCQHVVHAKSWFVKISHKVRSYIVALLCKLVNANICLKLKKETYTRVQIFCSMH